jgi:hypothetical protein
MSGASRVSRKTRPTYDSLIFSSGAIYRDGRMRAVLQHFALAETGNPSRTRYCDSCSLGAVRQVLTPPNTVIDPTVLMANLRLEFGIISCYPRRGADFEAALAVII